jgi:hypothetical protein
VTFPLTVDPSFSVIIRVPLVNEATMPAFWSLLCADCPLLPVEPPCAGISVPNRLTRTRVW